MADQQLQKKQMTLKLKQGTYNYKLFIPKEVEQKIQFICKKLYNTEWSGTLFFEHSGSFENNDLVITCKDIYVMDIGGYASTEFDMNPDVISYMTENAELLDCQLGLVHSHHSMKAFFSTTDQNTLKEEGGDRNNFVSLIVNNEGEYVAAITRKIKTKKISEDISYEFFGDGTKNIENRYDDEETIEYFYLTIEKEDDSSFKYIKNRLDELKKQKEEKIKKQTPIQLSNKNVVIGTNKFYDSSYYYDDKLDDIPFSDSKNTTLSMFDDEDFYKEKANTNIINSLVRQLLTCSLIVPNKDKIDINKWASNIPKLYEKIFGKGEEGIKSFKEWAEMYIEFLTYNVKDTKLASKGYDIIDIQIIYARDLLKALKALPLNRYINIYITALEMYLK